MAGPRLFVGRAPMEPEALEGPVNASGLQVGGVLLGAEMVPWRPGRTPREPACHHHEQLALNSLWLAC